VRQFGRGIDTAQKAMKDNGNPPLEFNPTQDAMVCILRK